MSALKRRESSSSQAPVSGSFAGTADELVRWPAILEFVSAERWPDGAMRTPGSLVVFVEQGRLKVCVNDKSQGLVAFVTAESLVGLLDAAEAILVSETGDWRATRKHRPGGGRT